MTRTDRHTPTMVAVLAVAALPHFSRVSPWIPYWTLAVWAWTLFIHFTGRPQPKSPLRNLLLVAGLGIVIVTSIGSYTLRTGVGLLLVLASLKPLEVATPRDRLTTLLLAYFLAAINVLASQSIAMAVAMAVAVLTTTAALMHVNHPAPLARSKLRLSAALLIQALPFTAVLFVAFPRLPASTLGIPEIGVPMDFKHSLRLDGMEDSADDQTPVFRVEFEGPMPAASLLYWRGYTLSLHGNGVWQQTSQGYSAERPMTGSDSVNYVMTMEPHGERWLFALDMPLAPPPDASMHGDQTLILDKDLESTRRFVLTSALNYTLAATSNGRRTAFRQELDLPNGNPRSRQLAAQWANSAQSDADIVHAALDMFRSENFTCAIAPPDPLMNEVDAFLFDTRCGLCDHFTTAFTFLMHAAGVPCRIVMGYKGGELNPLGNYLIVRQSHAYAWNEVWLQGRGWVRVDPMAVANPSDTPSDQTDGPAPGNDEGDALGSSDQRDQQADGEAPGENGETPSMPTDTARTWMEALFPGEASPGTASDPTNSPGEAEDSASMSYDEHGQPMDTSASDEASSGMAPGETPSGTASDSTGDPTDAQTPGEDRGTAGMPSDQGSPWMEALFPGETSSGTASDSTGASIPGENREAPSMPLGEGGQLMHASASGAAGGVASTSLDQGGQSREASGEVERASSMSSDNQGQSMGTTASGGGSPGTASGSTGAPGAAGSASSSDGQGCSMFAPAPGEGGDTSSESSEESGGLMATLSQAWDAADYYWKCLVLDYTTEQQQSLFSSLGMDTDSGITWRQAALVGMALLGLLFGLVLLRAWLLRPRSDDPLRDGYERFCYKLTLMNVFRPPYMGPRDLEEHIAQQRSDLIPETRPIIDLYVALRYADVRNAMMLQDFTRAVSEFTPRPRPAPSQRDAAWTGK